MAERPYLSISETAKIAGVSVDALRYYERSGLMLHPIERSASNHRCYSERDVRWVAFLTKMRKSGMPIRRMREYTQLIRAGRGNEDQRIAPLEAHRRAVLADLDEKHRDLREIERKIDEYRGRIVEVEGAFADPDPPRPHDSRRLSAAQ